MTLVLDGSVAIAWCFRDERTPALDALRTRVATSSAVVPSIWPLEVANALLMGVRRGRIAAQERDHLLQAFEQLDLEHDAETRLHAWGGINRLAGQHRLTVYDACYLELALRRRLPLATLDAALARAAIAEGLTILP